LQQDADSDGLGNPCDSCPADNDPPTVVLVEDFETGAAGWTHAPRTAADTWHLADQNCFGDALGSTLYVSNGNAGPNCLEDSSVEHSELLSPPFGLPATGRAVLAFDTLSYDEPGPCLETALFDGKDVGITTDGGATYQRLNDCFALADGEGELQRFEFDISGFLGQTVQAIFVYDTGDNRNLHTFAVDNLSVRVYPDLDQDSSGDACDCAPQDGSAFVVPLEVGNVFLEPDKTTLLWDSGAATSGSGIVYDVMRGDLGQLPVGAGVSEICVASDVALTTAGDPAQPSPGTAYYYLIRGANVCGVGTWGQDSTPAERMTAVCP